MADQPPRPWKDGAEASPDEAFTAELVRRVALINPRPAEVGAGWDDVVERVVRPRGVPRVVWVAAAAALLLVAVGWFAGRRTAAGAPAPVVATPAPPAPAPHLPGSPPPTPPPMIAVEPYPAPAHPSEVPHPPPVKEPEAAPLPKGWVASKGASWAPAEEGAIKLEHGRLEALGRPGAAARVQTPEVTVVSAFARFATDVTESGTLVVVLEGDVVVSSAKEKLSLHPGESRLFPSVAVPSALEPLPPEQGNPACAKESLDNRLSCLADQAEGDGLKAQTALYEKAYLEANAGRPAAAEATLRELLKRFPKGVLDPEARLALLRVLMAEDKQEAALQVGHGFLTECAGDPRQHEVASFVDTLEWIRSR